MIMKEGTLMHSHFETLDHRNLTPKYPMAMSGIGAGHTTNLGRVEHFFLFFENNFENVENSNGTYRQNL